MSEKISTSAPGTQSKSEKPSTPKKKLKKKQLDDKLSVSLSKCVSTWTMISQVRSVDSIGLLFAGLHSH